MSHFFKSLVQSYVYLLCLDWARNGSYTYVNIYVCICKCQKKVEMSQMSQMLQILSLYISLFRSSVNINISKLRCAVGPRLGLKSGSERLSVTHENFHEHIRQVCDIDIIIVSLSISLSISLSLASLSPF